MLFLTAVEKVGPHLNETLVSSKSGTVAENVRRRWELASPWGSARRCRFQLIVRLKIDPHNVQCKV